MKKNLLYLGCLAVALWGCTDQIDNLEIETLNPKVSAPIGTVTLRANNLDSLFNDVTVRPGPDNVIEFYYDQDFIEAPVYDRFTIKDQNFDARVPFSSALFTNGEAVVVSPEEFNSFEIDNIDLPDPAPELTLLRLNGGSLDASQIKDFDHNLVTKVTFPTIIKDGVALSVDLTNIDNTTVSLVGYDMDLTGAGGDKVNTIEYAITSNVTETGVSDTGSFELSFAITDMSFEYLEGDLKSYSFEDIEGYFDLNIPENEIPDNVRFTDPKIDIIVTNSAGIPFGLMINDLAVVEDNGDTSSITGDFLTETPLLAGADNPGEVKTSNYLISNANTDNLIELISQIPNGVYFNGFVNANPSGQPVDNFVTNTSQVNISAQMILPLVGYVNNYALTQNFDDVSLSVSDSGEVTLDNVNIRVISENAFPVNIAIQLYFIEKDEAGNELILDSLFNSFDESIICPSGELDANGIVSGPTELLSDISVSQDKYERIESANKIQLVGRLISPGAADPTPKSVKFTYDNYLTVKLGLSAQAIIDPKKLINNDK